MDPYNKSLLAENMMIHDMIATVNGSFYCLILAVTRLESVQAYNRFMDLSIAVFIQNMLIEP